MTGTALTDLERDECEQLAELPWGDDILARIFVGVTEGLIGQGALVDTADRGYWAAAIYLHDAVPGDVVDAWRASRGV